MKRLQQATPWTCPRCGERFTTRNLWHSCGTFELEPLFAKSEPQVRRIYERFLERVRACGPVKVIPQKTRIAFQAGRMRFAAVTPRKGCLAGHLILAEKSGSPCFEKVVSLSKHSHQHVFRLEDERQIGAEFQRLLRAAYAVGQGEHLRPPS